MSHQVSGAMLRRLASVVRTRATFAVRHSFVKLRVEPIGTQDPLLRLATAVRASACTQGRAHVHTRIRVLRTGLA